MSGNLIGSLAALANLKQLDKTQLQQIIQDGLFHAISKKLHEENELKIVTNFESNKIVAQFYRIVVEQDFELGQISLAEARSKYDAQAELGDKIAVEIPITDFEPKVIKIARKAILERIKGLEEDRIMFDYEKQKFQVVSGKVRKNEFNGYVVDIGYADALLPLEEQVDEEYYKPGDIIRAFVINIRKRKTDVIVILSRTRPEFVMKLFESEIPEITNKEVEVKKIVREPGIRTKVAVASLSKGIDAMAACLGPKGIRIEQIRKELNGEFIDIVLWDESPEQLIANAIGPDLVEKVYLAERGKFARIIVQENNKNLAIGKKGKNVKLAAKLTDFKLDIYTEEEFEEKISEERRITSHISDLDGVSTKIADILKEHGYTSVQDIFDSTIEELCNMEGLGKKTAEKIKESAKYF
ncbi:MAG: transcription termination factor NusA [Candidatus Cloacimonetes bacterium]|nr:transcription termination factor NusA [Candidatus Cloacimonadota bacterium]